MSTKDAFLSRITQSASRSRHFEDCNGDIVQSVRQLVEIESPSESKAAVDRLGLLLADSFESLGGRIKFHRTANFGDHLQANFPGVSGGKPVLLLGHLDTVYPLGALATMPCRIEGDRIYGPGTLDMKSGIALVFHAIKALRGSSGRLPRPATVLLVSDEEVGSESSRLITENLAKKSVAVLVLEPGYGLRGKVKTARKGIGAYTIKVIGKAAHSGLDFEKGASAILELAKQIQKVSQLVDSKRGITLNVGIVQGGTAVNVVPAEATAALDLRFTDPKDGIDIDRKLRSFRPFDGKCQVVVAGGINRPPMVRTSGVADLFHKASAIAKASGWKLGEASVGGGSDGNFTASLGIPTLDGLGGVGEGAHAIHESVVISQLPRRAALLASLIENV